MKECSDLKSILWPSFLKCQGALRKPRQEKMQALKERVCKNAISFASYSRENKELKVALLTSLCLKKKWASSQSSKVGERIQGPVPQIVGPNNSLLLQVASSIVLDHRVEKESIQKLLPVVNYYLKNLTILLFIGMWKTLQLWTRQLLDDLSILKS